MKIAIEELRQKVIHTLSQSFNSEDADRIAEVLIWADMSGIKPMGVAKMTGTEPIQSIKPQHEIRIERDTKLSTLINAGANPAPLVCQQAVEVAIQKAQDHGFGIVGVNNTFSSNLTQAFYVERIAKEDLIGIAMSRAPSTTAPFNSIDPLFGTNPMGFAFPTQDDPLIFDMTTAAMTWSGIVLAKARGEKLPENIAIDSEGNPTTDPSEAMKGATLPFDNSYKSSGLGLIVETLAGPLVGSSYCDYNQDHYKLNEYGSLFMAIDPSLLVDVNDFKTHSSELIKKVKGARKKPGVEEIRLPGERARLARQKAAQEGLVDIDEKVLRTLGYI